MSREVIQVALDDLESVLCSPDGYASISGSAFDNAVIDSVLITFRAELAKPDPAPFAWAACCQGQEVVLFFEEPSDESFPSGACWKFPLYRKEDV
jgi:hypothetical protein